MRQHWGNWLSRLGDKRAQMSKENFPPPKFFWYFSLKKNDNLLDINDELD